MKRIIPLLSLLLFLIPGIYAAQPDFFVNGDFGTYHDTRGALDFYRSYCGFHIDEGASVFFIRNIDNKTGSTTKYMVKIVPDDEGSVRIDEISGYDDSHPADHTQSYIDLLNFLNFTMTHKKEIQGRVNLKDDWGPHTEIYKYDETLPLFKFYEIQLQGSETDSFKLVTTGRINQNQIEDFFNFKPFSLPDHTIEGRVDLSDSPAVKQDLYDYTLDLDENWVFNDQLGFPGYWISKYTVRDAQIMLEREEFDRYRAMGLRDLRDFADVLMFPEGFRVLFDSFQVEETGDAITVSKYLLDTNGVYNYSCNRFWIEDGFIYTLNFSSYAFMYDLNKDYFDHVIHSLSKR